VGNEIFNVGSNQQNYKIIEVAKIIERLVEGAAIETIPFTGDLRNYQVDFNKIRNRLGFQTLETVETGVKQVIDSLQNGAVQDYRDPRFSNVRFLSEADGVELLRYDQEFTKTLYLIGPEAE